MKKNSLTVIEPDINNFDTNNVNIIIWLNNINMITHEIKQS